MIDTPTPQISAADVVCAQLTDQGLLVANRTPLPIRLEVEICSHGSNTIIETVRIALSPRDEGTVPRGRLHNADNWSFPKAVLRQWSHEAGPAYEGGDLKLGMVKAVFLDGDGAERGSTRREGGAGLGAFLTSSDIRAALE